MSERDATAGIGGKIGGRVADYLTRSYLSTKDQSSGHLIRVGMQMQDEFFRLTGGELKRTVGPLLGQLADAPDGPKWARDTFQFLARGQGQWQTMLGGALMGAALGSGILELINNELNPLITPVIAANPHGKFTPEQAAAVQAHGLNWGADLAYEAAQKGLDSNRYNALVELATTVLSPDVIVELYRRGELDRAAALRFLTRAGFEGDHAKRLLVLARTHLTLPDASAMYNRSIITLDELRNIGIVNGYSATDALRYGELGGEPPSPELLYAAYRRGVISADRLKRGITQGPIRNEWIDVIEQMQYHSMTPDSAASAVTQGHMTLQRGETIAKEYGLKPEDFAVIVETAGRPPGLEFAAEAYLRGFITDRQWEEMFLESAIKNRYIPVMRQMRTRLLPQETARSMLAKGVITETRCAEILTQHGFAPDDVRALIASSTMERSAPQRDLSLSTVRALYVEQEISADDASEMLRALGFDDNEIGWELALAEIARVRTYRNAAVTRIKSGYVKGLLSQQDVSTSLDALRVPPGRRDALMDIWDIERTTVTRDLTPAQIITGAKKGIIDPPTALSRLMGQGYAEDDAAVLLLSANVALS